MSQGRKRTRERERKEASALLIVRDDDALSLVSFSFSSLEIKEEGLVANTMSSYPRLTRRNARGIIYHSAAKQPICSEPFRILSINSRLSFHAIRPKIQKHPVLPIEFSRFFGISKKTKNLLREKYKGDII